MSALGQQILQPPAPSGPSGVEEILRRGATDIVVLQPNAPAAGAALTVTVPGDYWYRVLIVSFRLATSAAAGTRTPFVALKTADGNLIANAGIAFAQAASVTRDHSFSTTALERLTLGTPLPGAGAALTGLINADGTIAGGTGFTVAKGVAGIYTVTFTTAFAATPLVLATIASALGTRAIELSALTASSFQATTFDTPTGTSSDNAWNFLAQAVA